ncbi:homocysteine S-methyltransferase family protein [candidate division KSB1 bacterium]|nr:MAG: homocysteine S-methyltransferase family protein [candidate division KSB1 bacterium]
MSGEKQPHAVLILDGAMGTELERRGFDARLPLWSAWALIEAPDLVKQIHADYIRAGAQVLTAATFRTTRHTLAKEKLAAWSGELTALAIRLAREAATSAAQQGEITVAGSIAPLEDCYHPELTPADEILVREHDYTAKILAQAGVDILLVETQNSAREAEIAARAALGTGLPVWVSLMPRNEREFFNGELLLPTARRLRDLGASAILINCCPPNIAAAAFRALRADLTDVRLGVYPNFAAVEGQPWDFSAKLTPADFAEWALPLVPETDVLGGCCGTTPEHIAALHRAISGHK